MKNKKKVKSYKGKKKKKVLQEEQSGYAKCVESSNKMNIKNFVLDLARWNSLVTLTRELSVSG